MASWRHTLLALAALALGALLAGCTSDTTIDPNTIPWVQHGMADPPVPGPWFLSPSGKGLQNTDIPGNGLR
jgi:hypothetical protein